MKSSREGSPVEVKRNPAASVSTPQSGWPTSVTSCPRASKPRPSARNGCRSPCDPQEARSQRMTVNVAALVRAWQATTASRRRLRQSRLLLRNAVERAEAPDQVERRPEHDAPRGEEPLQDIARLGVVRMIKAGHNDDIVRDVEIRIAPRQTLPVLLDITRCGQIDNVPRLALRIAHCRQPLAVLVEQRVI